MRRKKRAAGVRVCVCVCWGGVVVVVNLCSVASRDRNARKWRIEEQMDEGGTQRV